MHFHRDLLATCDTYGRHVLQPRGDDVFIGSPPIAFTFGLGGLVLFPMRVGAASVPIEQAPPPRLIEAIETVRPTVCFTAPTAYRAMLAMLGEHDVPSLRTCVSAGEPLPRPTWDDWRERTGIGILDGIGSTEMLHIFVSNRPGDVRYGTSGKPVPGYDAKIIDEHGNEVGAGEIGELVVRGPSAADGYWNQRAKSRRTFAGEWTYTGDKYIRDEQGYYQYCGRTDDMFKVSGNWVSPFEVEAALASHDAVLEAAVIGEEDDDKLVKPKAYIVLKPGIAADAALLESLKAHVKSSAGMWKYPRWIEFRADLPKTATGKIQRFKLREADKPA
jgi:4-hydroxybenzoate-CoA ligase